MPLGWRLSSNSQKTIDLIAGRSNECGINNPNSTDTTERSIRVSSVLQANACIGAWVEQRLSPKAAR